MGGLFAVEVAVTRVAWVGVATLCLLGSGCRDVDPPRMAPTAQERPPLQEAPRNEPREEGMRKEAPEPLLMEMWVTRPTVRPSGYRILADGTWWDYRDFDLVLALDPSTQEATTRRIRVEEGWWDSECRLSPKELAKLKDTIRASGVMELPSETPPSPGGVIGGSDVYYTFQIDGRRHRIHYLEGGDEVPPQIDDVEELASKVIFNSQQRRLRDRGEDHSPLVDF